MTDLPASVRWQLWIVAFGFFMQSLDTTIVNTALPSMAKSLGESPLHMHMIIVSYVLTVAVMLPASGWLADRVGVRNIFFTAIVLFTAGSLFCAQASTLDQLVMARVLQGVGGAMMVPVGRLTVMKIVPRDQYMAAMTFVTLPARSARCSARRWAACWWSTPPGIGSSSSISRWGSSARSPPSV